MSTAGSIRCHDAGPTGGVLLLNLLRIFWALGEHKAKARHLLALVFLFFALFSCARVSLRSGGRCCSSPLDNVREDRQADSADMQTDIRRLTSHAVIQSINRNRRETLLLSGGGMYCCSLLGAGSCPRASRAG